MVLGSSDAFCVHCGHSLLSFRQQGVGDGARMSRATVSHSPKSSSRGSRALIHSSNFGLITRRGSMIQVPLGFVLPDGSHVVLDVLTEDEDRPRTAYLRPTDFCSAWALATRVGHL